MAMTGIQIFKLLPGTNCRKCGCATCLAFAMNLSSGKVKLDGCPDVSAESWEKFHAMNRSCQAQEAGVKLEESCDSNAQTGYAGTIYGNVSNASTTYGYDKFSNPRGGHGFAAEKANHLFDTLTGNEASIVGDDNIKNGADRLVNGVNIQSKYCATGSICISECFDGDTFRYLNPDGTPMKIEVPSDKYDSAVQAMQERIRKGQIPGVSDPQEAKNIVKKGHFTYEQAKNIAKFGTVESLTFDAVNGVIVAGVVTGVSSAISLAVSIWNGDDIKVALKNSALTGLKIGGQSFVVSILSGQLARTGLNSALVGSSEFVIKIFGPKFSATLVNAFRSGTNIYGAAAMKSAAKLLRGNVMTSAISFAVLSTFDIADIFRSRISGAQLAKNMAITGASVAGGTGGWAAGAAAGAFVGTAIPIVGTAIGGAVGGLLGAFTGGTISNKAAKAGLDKLVKEDSEEMLSILEDVFKDLAFEYILNKEEAEQVASDLQSALTPKLLKEMFARSSRREFSKELLVPLIEKYVKQRKFIPKPIDDELIIGLKLAIGELEDSIKKDVEDETETVNPSSGEESTSKVFSSTSTKEQGRTDEFNRRHREFWQKKVADHETEQLAELKADLDEMGLEPDVVEMLRLVPTLAMFKRVLDVELKNAEELRKKAIIAASKRPVHAAEMLRFGLTPIW